MLEYGLQEAEREVRFYQTRPRESKVIFEGRNARRHSSEDYVGAQQEFSFLSFRNSIPHGASQQTCSTAINADDLNDNIFGVVW